MCKINEYADMQIIENSLSMDFRKHFSPAENILVPSVKMKVRGCSTECGHQVLLKFAIVVMPISGSFCREVAHRAVKRGRGRKTPCLTYHRVLATSSLSSRQRKKRPTCVPRRPAGSRSETSHVGVRKLNQGLVI